MNSLKKVVIGGIIFIFLIVTNAVSKINGGYGLNHVRSAWSLKPGYLTLTTKTHFFGKVSSELQKSAVTYWVVQGAFSLNYGVNDHLELALTPIVYQDNHKGQKGYNLPDDLYLSVKLGSYDISGSSIKYGLMMQTRFPTAEHHNVLFEPYSANSISWGFEGMATYSKDPLYPEDNMNIHFNLGYTNFNDVGEKLSSNDQVDTVSVRAMSQELRFGLGIEIPTSEFDFSVELFGNTFLQKPPKETAFSRENYLYLTPGIKFRAYRWLSLNFSTDLRLSSNNDETEYVFDTKIAGMPNYPSWRVNLGASMVLLPTKVYQSNEKDILIKKAESRRELFEQIIREQRETESAEQELERIKTERRKAERELERLRRILEGGSRPTKDNNDDQND